MSIWFILIAMVFFHVIDDFCLQTVGVLAQMKQRRWWKEHAPQKNYQYDFLVALAMHSLSWAFLIMLPVAWFWKWNPPPLFFVLFGANAFVHGVVDHCKANLLKINLITDQTIHLVQIVTTFMLLM